LLHIWRTTDTNIYYVDAVKNWDIHVKEKLSFHSLKIIPIIWYVGTRLCIRESLLRWPVSLRVVSSDAVSLVHATGETSCRQSLVTNRLCMFIYDKEDSIKINKLISILWQQLHFVHDVTLFVAAYSLISLMSRLPSITCKRTTMKIHQLEGAVVFPEILHFSVIVFYVIYATHFPVKFFMVKV